jgi:hypothetical protein
MPLPFECGRKIEIMPKKIPEETKAAGDAAGSGSLG